MSAPSRIEAAAAPHHDELLDAMNELELALAAPAPGREREWCERFATKLRELYAALERHVLKAELPGRLFAHVEASAPPLHHRIVRLKHQHADLFRQIGTLDSFVEHDRDQECFDFREIRHRARWLLTGLRHHTALWADLIFELYDNDFARGDRIQ